MFGRIPVGQFFLKAALACCILPLSICAQAGQADGIYSLPDVPLYSFESLIDSNQKPTSLFVRLREGTDRLVREARLPAASAGQEPIALLENGSCAVPAKDFEARQALGLAFHVGSAEKYAATYAKIGRTFGEMIEGQPPLKSTGDITTEFQQRRARDQYWRKLISAIRQGKTTGLARPEFEQLLTNYIVRAMCHTDRANTAFLENFVEDRGWPAAELYGEEISQAAWLITQHSDRNIGFQRRALELLQAELTGPFADKSGFAYLFDRVAINSGRPQRYGTQIRCEEGAVVPKPLEDVARLDILRDAMELGPIEDYLASFVHCARRP